MGHWLFRPFSTFYKNKKKIDAKYSRLAKLTINDTFHVILFQNETFMSVSLTKGFMYVTQN